MNDLITKRELDDQVLERRYKGQFPLVRALFWALLLTSLPVVAGFVFGTGLINTWYAWLIIALNGWVQGTIMGFRMTKTVLRDRGYNIGIELKR